MDGPRAAVVATRLAELMGIYERPSGSRIEPETVRSVILAAAAHGLAEELAARNRGAQVRDSDAFDLLDALQQSPMPAQEIRSLSSILGPATVQELAGASDASLRRYAASSRETPDAIAQRLHFVALLVAILRGSFNEFGIRRWFERPHPALEGEPPITRLSGNFDPDDPGPQAVYQAASSLLR
jgi:hypothetical protein